ncbi:Polycystic Kidney Disease Protein 1-Like 1 [Manis pentadactyla]|nr:Polycystic Kidney Disease Protein 1-Like 1 [Manis pentadactyla]
MTMSDSYGNSGKLEYIQKKMLKLKSRPRNHITRGTVSYRTVLHLLFLKSHSHQTIACVKVAARNEHSWR